MISTKASAVSGPTPGWVLKRCASGHFSASCSMASVSSAIVGFSRSSNASRSSRRRRDLLALLDRLNPTIAELTEAIEQEAEKCPEAQRLRTHPGVGRLTALAFVLIIGRAERFQCGKQIACYLGLVPLEDSSGDRRRLGHITKQGNSLLRFLLVEAAQVTVRSDQQWRSKYFHLAMRRGRKIAKVAMARRLAIQMYWMMRKGWDYEQVKKFGSHAGQPGNPHGVQ